MERVKQEAHMDKLQHSTALPASYELRIMLSVVLVRNIVGRTQVVVINYRNEFLIAYISLHTIVVYMYELFR